jgi:sRNA-binding carbon storage regulator CsrA
MSYLAKALTPNQEFVVQLTPTAEREDVVRRLSLDGIRIKVLNGLKFGTVKLGVFAPAGLVPVRREVSNTPKVKGVGRLTLTRHVGEEIVITLAPGADADAGAVLDWLASDGVVISVEALNQKQQAVHIKAINGLLVLRSELIGEAIPA